MDESTWFILWWFLACLAVVLALGLLLSARSQELAAALSTLYTELGVFLGVVLIYPFTSARLAEDWAYIAVATAQGASLAAWVVGWAATPQETLERRERAKARRRAATGVAGRLEVEDLVGLGASTAAYLVVLGLGVGGVVSAERSTDDDVAQVLYGLGGLVVVGFFAAFLVRVARYTIHERAGAAWFLGLGGAALAASAALAAVTGVAGAPASALVVETAFMLVCLAVTTLAGSILCGAGAAAATRRFPRAAWRPPPPAAVAAPFEPQV